MNWREEYRNKCMDAAQALEAVRSGDRVWLNSGCGVPEPLVDAMVAQAFRLRDVEIVHEITMGSAAYARPEYEGIFRHNGLFLGGNVREAAAAGRADYTPIFLSEIEDLISSGAFPLDVALIQVSPPDERGFVSLGTAVDCNMTAARCARTVIAEVNERMPRTHGETFIHISRLSSIVETSRPLLELAAEPFTETHRRIGENVASLVPDGATLQMGIGAIPDAVLACLEDKRNLGIHTEMCSNGVIPLMESGVMNGACNKLHPGKQVLSFAIGRQPLFDYIDDNPCFEFRPIRYTNDSFVVAQNDRMVAINSALQVDLTGQVCADSLGTKPYSAWADSRISCVARHVPRTGCPLSRCLQLHGMVRFPRIVPVLAPGAGVVTTRADVHYVVTEYGIAYLHGKTLRERAVALIAIADPRFRNELEDFAVRSNTWIAQWWSLSKPEGSRHAGRSKK